MDLTTSTAASSIALLCFCNFSPCKLHAIFGCASEKRSVVVLLVEIMIHNKTQLDLWLFGAMAGFAFTAGVCGAGILINDGVCHGRGLT